MARIKVISKFRGEHNFLSNMYTYNKGESVEAKFQKAKCKLESDRIKFYKGIKPTEAKKLGRCVVLRDDWSEVKNDIMYELVYRKFADNEDLKEKLIATGKRVLIEGNNWCDNYWGNCVCDKCKGINGENYLGRILMRVRKELGGK